MINKHRQWRCRSYWVETDSGGLGDSHGEVGDESRRGQVHFKRSLLGDGELVPYWTLDHGNSIAGHHRTLHMVVRHLQLVTSQMHVQMTLRVKGRSVKAKDTHVIHLWKSTVGNKTYYTPLKSFLVQFFHLKQILVDISCGYTTVTSPIRYHIWLHCALSWGIRTNKSLTLCSDFALTSQQNKTKQFFAWCRCPPLVYLSHGGACWDQSAQYKPHQCRSRQQARGKEPHQPVTSLVFGEVLFYAKEWCLLGFVAQTQTKVLCRKLLFLILYIRGARIQLSFSSGTIIIVCVRWH